MRKMELRKLAASLSSYLFMDYHIQLLNSFVKSAAINQLSDESEVNLATFHDFLQSQQVDKNSLFYLHSLREATNSTTFFHLIFAEYLGFWRDHFLQLGWDVYLIDCVIGTGYINDISQLYNKLTQDVLNGKVFDKTGRFISMSVVEVLILTGVPQCFDYAVKKLGLTKHFLGIEKQTALHWAVKSRSRKQVEKALALGVNPNYESEEGVTALHIAASIGDTDIIATLVASGAIIANRNSHHESVLDCAFQANQFLAMQWLIEHAADEEQHEYNMYKINKLNQQKTNCEYVCCLAWISIKEKKFAIALDQMLLMVGMHDGVFVMINAWFDIVARGLAAIIDGFDGNHDKLVAMRNRLTHLLDFHINTAILPANYISLFQKTIENINEIMLPKTSTAFFEQLKDAPKITRRADMSEDHKKFMV